MFSYQIDEVWIGRFCVRYDWWRRLQPTSSVSPVCWMPFRPGPPFNIKMSSYQYMKSHCGDKTILRPSYLHNRISYTGKTTSLYWIMAQDDSLFYQLGCVVSHAEDIPCGVWQTKNWVPIIQYEVWNQNFQFIIIYIFIIIHIYIHSHIYS